MANVNIPAWDGGRASFEVLDTYTNTFLLAGQDPPLRQPFDFDLPNSVSYAQFSVVGLDAAGKLVMATYGATAVAATGTLTFSGTGSADETVVIGGRTYTLKSSLSAANQVLIGASATATAANLVAAINGAAGAGTTYGTGTLANAEVSASSAAGVVTITAREAGVGGNAIPTTETSAAASWGATTMTGGREEAGVKPIGVLAQAASLGASGSLKAPVFYSGCFNSDALVWHSSFDSDAKKAVAFIGSPTPTTILTRKRGS